MRLHRYWIKFNTTLKDPYPASSVFLGVGVTALTEDDALYLIRLKIFEGQELPPIKEIIEDIDVSTLDPKHVLYNIRGNPAARGIWFPQGFDF